MRIQGCGLGQFCTAPAPTPALDDMHCFRKLRLRLRAPKGAGPGKNQQFLHFDSKNVFTAYRTIKQGIMCLFHIC